MAPKSRKSPKSLVTIRQSLCLALLAGFLAGPARPAGPIDAAPPSNACAPEAGSLCLGDGRFLVEVGWFGEPLVDGAEARALGADAAYFRSPGGAGLVVQVVDGRAVNGHFWVLTGAIAHPSYSLEVTDLSTGQHRSYSELDGGAGGALDLLALPAAGRATDQQLSRLTAFGCPAEGPGVCLDSGRLRVEARTSGSADLVAGEALSEQTAIFRRVGERDPELVVSVLDGGEVDGQRWVLSTSPTGQEWDLALADLGNGESGHLRHAGAAIDVQLRKKPRGGTRVAVTLDVPRAVKKKILVAGGSIQAQSANGTKFTLTIPANALLSPQEFTLTPIKSIGGLPFKGGMAGGVEIEPAGLRFAATASLLIAPLQPVPLVQETTFGYRARGAQFFLYPALLVGKPVVLPVIHTGGYGLARGTAKEQTTQLGRLPPRAEDQFDQKLWNLHAQKRRTLKSLAGESVDRSAAPAAAAPVDLPTFYKEVFRDQLRKLLAEIAGSCAGRKKWGSYAENFIAKAVADGLAAGLTAETAELRIALNIGTAACYNETGKACLVEKDHKAPIPMLVYWRQLVFAGATNLVDASKLQSCLTFEFEFSSVVDQDAGNPPPSWNAGGHHVLDTKTPVRWRPPFHFGQGLPGTPHSYAAKWTAARQQGVPPIVCNFSETGKVFASNLSVYEMLFLGVNSFEESPPLPKIEIVYNPGNPKMEVLQVCPGPGAIPIPPYFLALFTPAYVLLHGNEIDFSGEVTPLFPEFAFRVTDWDMRLGALYALRVYQRSGGFGSIKASEVTSLYVFHKPGG